MLIMQYRIEEWHTSLARQSVESDYHTAALGVRRNHKLAVRDFKIPPQVPRMLL